MTQALFTLLGVGTSSGVPRLGCSCAICTTTDIEPKNRRQRVAGLLEIGDKKLLVDAGPDIRNQLLEQKVCHIDALFVTHNHFDHIAGIDDVKWITGYPNQSLPIYANRSTYSDLKKRINYLLKPVLGGNSPSFYLKQIRRWEMLDFYGCKIQTLEYSQQNEGHTRPTQVTGFRLGDFAFLTDIKRYEPRLIQELKGIKTLVLGAVRDGDSIAHFTFEEAHHFSKLSGAEKTFFIHLDHSVDYPEASKRLPPNVQLGYDGMKIAINLS